MSHTLADGAFARNEFLDNFGQRTYHLNGLIQMLCQFGGTAGAVATASKEGR